MLTKYILTTIVYYDVMDYPMTAFEIWKYLTRVSGEDENIEKFSLADVVKGLEDEKLRRFIEEYRGFYFLQGRKNLVFQRSERNKISVRKIKIVKRVVFWLRFVPFVRGVAIAGRLAMKNAEEKSDLDLLIVLKKHRIFTGRLLVTLLVQLLGKRRHDQKVRDRICLNHFVTTKYSILSKDLFSAHEYSFLMPIFGLKKFRKFQVKNDWIAKYKINSSSFSDNVYIVSDTRITKFIRKNLEKLLKFNSMENFLGQWQKEKIAKNPKSKQKGGII